MSAQASSTVTPGVTVGVKNQNGEWWVILTNGSGTWSGMGATQAHLVACQLRMCAQAVEGAPEKSAEARPTRAHSSDMQRHFDQLRTIEEQLSLTREAMEDALDGEDDGAPAKQDAEMAEHAIRMLTLERDDWQRRAEAAEAELRSRGGADDH